MQNELNKVLSRIESIEKKYARSARHWFWVLSLINSVTLFSVAAAGVIPILAELNLWGTKAVFASLALSIAGAAQLVGQSNGLTGAYSRCRNTQVNLEILQYKIEQRRVVAIGKVEGKEVPNPELSLITKYAYSELAKIIENNSAEMLSDINDAVQHLATKIDNNVSASKQG